MTLTHAREKAGPPIKKATWESVLEGLQWKLKQAQAKGDSIAELLEAVKIAKKRVRDKDPFPNVSTQN